MKINQLRVVTAKKTGYHKLPQVTTEKLSAMQWKWLEEQLQEREVKKKRLETIRGHENITNYKPNLNFIITTDTMDTNTVVTIDKNDDVKMIAMKIFEQFKVLQSVTIEGFEFVPTMGWIEPGKVYNRPFIKGELVWDEIMRLDDLANFYDGNGRRRRKRIKLTDTNGAPVAQKIFRKKKTVLNEMPRITIWRVQ